MGRIVSCDRNYILHSRFLILTPYLTLTGSRAFSIGKYAMCWRRFATPYSTLSVCCDHFHVHLYPAVSIVVRTHLTGIRMQSDSMYIGWTLLMGYEMTRRFERP
ncbi:uncharacterized protein BT62DRAFT_223521 [Guyanagaster necrorhizus]|uniref:Uncharacterized protein n=1 Tax=Guyanagaster necrorhizus TaxID=856835 RepID=A0A9P8AQU9_9AGAR|nr:uncharacterized protein BT62DRAFT_223521 [Guyanagaster necrorhizus MCA 3950]KAG7444723.1 hypothetical protein BT62DRAFT_223521 [Guyanagaster necrorhizus MCA 3950]